MTILKKIAYLTFGRGVAVIANIFAFVIAARFLSLDEYATFRQTFLPYEVLIPLLELGIPATLYYLLPRRADKFNLILETMMIFLMTISLFILFFVLGGIDVISNRFHNPDLKKTIPWLLLFTTFQLPVNLFMSVLVYEEKTKAIAIYSTISSIALSLSIIFFAITYQSYYPLVVIRSILPIIGTSILFFFIYRILRSTFNQETQPIVNMKSILKVSLPLGIASMAGLLSMQLDKVLVSSLTSPDIFAIYINGAMEIPLIGIVTGSIAAVILAEMSDSIKEGDLQRGHHLFSVSATKTALILFPVMIFFLYTARDFIILLFSLKYEASAIPFMIYLFLLPIRIVVFGSALIALGRNDIILKRSFLELILNIILSYLLFNVFGYIGVAIATVAVVYFWSVPYNLHQISIGFNIKIKKLFDYVQLIKIMMISIGLSPIILFVNLIGMPVIMYLLISFLLYFSSIFYIYKKYNYLIGMNK